MKIKTKILALNGIFLVLLILSPVFVNANEISVLDEGEVKAAVAVAAVVPTRVSEINSSITVNKKEALSDKKDFFLVTVKLRDKDNSPLPDIRVSLSSVRGEIDRIEAVGISGGTVTILGGDPPYMTRSNAEGFAFFKVTSSVPGETAFTALVDSLVTLPSETVSLTVKFLPLPFPENITISIAVPSIISPDGKITIFEPKDKESSIDRDKLVDLGTELIVPFYVLVIILILSSISPILIIIVMMLLRRIRKLNLKEIKVLGDEDIILEKEEKTLEAIADKQEKEEKTLEAIAEEEKVIESIMSDQEKNKDS